MRIFYYHREPPRQMYLYAEEKKEFAQFRSVESGRSLGKQCFGASSLCSARTIIHGHGFLTTVAVRLRCTARHAAVARSGTIFSSWPLLELTTLFFFHFLRGWPLYDDPCALRSPPSRKTAGYFDRYFVFGILGFLSVRDLEFIPFARKIYPLSN